MKPLAQFHDLKDYSVFITGGGSGIGASLTEGFLQQGARVAFIQRSNASEFVARCTEKYASTPLFIQCDITNITALQRAIDQAAEAHGAIDVLVNNAANDTRHSLQGFTVEQWDDAMNVNLRPHFFSAQRVAKNMKKASRGSIINFSSISYMMGNSGYPAYATAKAAITGMTRVLARELGADNIRVNALMPGWTLTERQQKLWATDEALQAHMNRQCLKQYLMPQDIVNPTLFLASDASNMMTGQALVIDGGVVVTG